MLHLQPLGPVKLPPKVISLYTSDPSQLKRRLQRHDQHGDSKRDSEHANTSTNHITYIP